LLPGEDSGASLGHWRRQCPDIFSRGQRPGTDDDRSVVQNTCLPARSHYSGTGISWWRAIPRRRRDGAPGPARAGRAQFARPL